ncbi:peptidase domain-containing ABC transporter [Flavobacterium oreochromis]|uniref:Peptidase domain-containing ABC transporter n=1 Tax=Flavobacterium oreochromis TaxID=2906078 RepID=A0ABW8PB85_9FLAO|nr:peptidase domain-containing ABC transporter [Flavobacterium oreochromis]OWP74396.1 ABC transporter ATP-binding protein [Flavobacterium oreochromis]
MNFKRFPHFLQLDAKDCGPTSLQIISRYYGKYFNLDEIREKCPSTKEGVSVYDICKGAEALGFKAMPVKTSYRRLYEEIPLPCIIHWRKTHFIVVYKVTKDKVYVSDPAIGLITYTKSEFVNGWIAHIREKQQWNKGVLIALEPTDKFRGLTSSQNTQSSSFEIINYLSGYLKPYKKQVLQLLATMIIVIMLQAVFPMITQSVVDSGISTKDLGFIQLLLIANVILVLSSSAGNWIRQSINMHISQRIKTSLLSNYIMKLLKLPLSFFENKLVGDILQRVMDYERIERFLMNSAFSIFLAVLNLIVFGVILVIYNSMLFWIFTIGSILYVSWVLLFWNIRKKMDLQYFSLMALNHSHWIEMLSNIQDIKNNNYEQGKRWRWEKVQVKLYHTATKLLNVNQSEMVGSNLINSLRDVALTFYSAMLVIDGEITFGMLIAVQYIIGQLKGPVSEVVNFISSYQSAKISYSRMSEVDRIEDEEQDEVASNSFFPESKSISLNNVVYRFHNNSRPIINNISIIIPEGKTTAIVGASGCGKSTLIKVLLRLYKPSSGEMLIGSSSSLNVSLKEWRDRIGVVTQDNQVFKDTILNNIVLGKGQFDKEQFMKAVKIANINDEIEKLPLGYNTLMGENGRGLSEGQKQRIFIARAIYKNPDYLFFDEATNALDSHNEKIVVENLDKQNKGKTVVIAAHRLATIKNADQILVMKDGRVVEIGNHEILLKKQGEYYKLFESQLSNMIQTA